ncbi:MAG: carbonic anhydrase [Planctomycetota bacterium]
MRKLLKGILEFRRTKRADYAARFERLALRQSPDALFIACSDSRVAANVFASTEPGDVFVVRNVGNIIPPCGRHGQANDVSDAAAIEFSVGVLGVKDIIVCGHSGCGAMHAICGGSMPPGAPNLAAWLRFAEPVLQRYNAGERVKHTEDLPPHDQLSQLNVLDQLANLRTYPAVQSAVSAGRLQLHGWWFDIGRAEVLAYDDSAQRFSLLDEEFVARLTAGDSTPGW